MTPRFSTKLRFEDDGGFPFTLIDPLVYGLTFKVGEVGVDIVVPAGFQTDLASIPRVLWNILPPIGKYDAAAVVHDFLYQRARTWSHGGPTTTRAGADAVLLEAMSVCGVSAWQRWAIYLGVRAGGWGVWNRYRTSQQVTT